MPRTTHLWNRKTSPGDQENLIAVLVALVQREGRVQVSRAELDAISGQIGLRARYEADGSVSLWTYDLMKDIDTLVGGPDLCQD